MTTPPPPPDPFRRRALAVATGFGAFGVASLPLMFAYSDQLAPYVLSLACAVSVAIVGEADGHRWLRAAGIGVVLLGTSSLILGLGSLVVSFVILGPLAVVLVLGPALRRIDPSAGTAFLSACAIAIAGGFAGAALSPPIVVAVTVLVLAGGAVTTISRLGEDPDLESELEAGG